MKKAAPAASERREPPAREGGAHADFENVVCGSLMVFAVFMKCYHETAMDDLELRHLRLVKAIADAGSVTRAGEILHLTQSALSHQLRDIESRLNAPLFHRVGRRMLPTEAGRRLIETAAGVLSAVRHTEDQIRRAARGGEGTLRISTECYTVYHWLPPLLKKYRLAHPMVDIQIDASATSNPVQALLDGKLDLAVVSVLPRDRRVAVHPLFDDNMVVITAPGHPLAARPYVRPEDFRTETLLLYARKEDSYVYKRIVARSGVTPRCVQQVQLTEAIIELVKAGLGVAILSEWAVAPHLRSRALRAVRLTRAGHRRRWSAVTLRETSDLAYVADFIRLMAINAPRPAIAAPLKPVLRMPRSSHA
jgi:LysR family transcriptional regulator, regulator for metE and metH